MAEFAQQMSGTCLSAVQRRAGALSNTIGSFVNFLP